MNKPQPPKPDATLTRDVAVLTERANAVDTKVDAKLAADAAKRETEISGIRRDIADLKAFIKTNAAERDAKAAEQELRIVNQVTVRIGVGVAILGLLIASDRFLPTEPSAREIAREVARETARAMRYLQLPPPLPAAPTAEPAPQ